MSWDYEKQEEKSNELQNSLLENLEKLGIPELEAKEAAKQLFKTYVNVTPPEKEQVLMHLVTTSNFGGRGGGKSVKSGNIKLNMPNLLEAVSAGVFTVISVNAAPWAIPFAAVLLWQSLWKSIKIDLTELDVVVLITLNRLKNNSKVVVEKVDDILIEVNKTLNKYERSLATKQDLNHSITNLDTIDSLDICDSGLFIREWVKVRYR